MANVLRKELNMRIPKKCGSCGSTNICIDNLKGKDFAWKDFSTIELMKDFNAPVCDNCGEIFFKLGSGKKLDELLEDSLKEKTAFLIAKILSESNLSQKELAAQLAMSEVYLSQLKNKKTGTNVSRSLFNLIKLLANDVGRIHELESKEQVAAWEISTLYPSGVCFDPKYMGGDYSINVSVASGVPISYAVPGVEIRIANTINVLEDQYDDEDEVMAA